MYITYHTTCSCSLTPKAYELHIIHVPTVKSCRQMYQNYTRTFDTFSSVKCLKEMVRWSPGFKLMSFIALDNMHPLHCDCALYIHLEQYLPYNIHKSRIYSGTPLLWTPLGPRLHLHCMIIPQSIFYRMKRKMMYTMYRVKQCNNRMYTCTCM